MNLKHKRESEPANMWCAQLSLINTFFHLYSQQKQHRNKTNTHGLVDMADWRHFLIVKQTF